MFKRLLVGIFIVLLTMPMFAYEVTLTIPLYGQQNSFYAGPACAKMILEGYPPPYPPVVRTQDEIWAVIQTHNSGEAGWATDPEGMAGALIEINPPPPGTTWSIKSYDVKEDLMFQILYWMNNNSFPVTTLVNGGAHWVDVVGYETDIEPIWGSDPELLEITIHDPWPIGQGQVSTMTGQVWYDTKWANPVSNPGTWENKYVAVIEPPDIQGNVWIRNVNRRGTDEISAQDALLFSEAWIDQLNLDAKNPSYRAIKDKDTTTLAPLLVREEIPVVAKDAQVPYYYIIPYKLKTDNPTVLSADSDSGYFSICVIVNAYTGDFEEITAFGTALDYLTADEAKEVAGVKEANTELIYTPCNVTQVRAYPIWRVETKEKTLYVDQMGNLYKGLTFQPYGR
jgi:hypothetical protein